MNNSVRPGSIDRRTHIHMHAHTHTHTHTDRQLRGWKRVSVGDRGVQARVDVSESLAGGDERHWI